MTSALATRGARWFTQMRDARRSLVRSPAFTIATVGILGIAIAAAVSTFSLVDAVLIRPLPYAHPEQLATVSGNFAAMRLRNLEVSAGEYHDYRDRTTAFAGFGAYRSENVTLQGNGATATTLNAIIATASLPSLLGVKPVRGRLFRADDDEQGAPPVALISAEFWQAHFNRDPSVVGKRLSIDGVDAEVVGILPADFTFPATLGSGVPDVWTILSFTPATRTARKDRNLGVVARLRSGTSVEAAQADLSRVAQTFPTDYPGQYPPSGAGWSASLSVMGSDRAEGSKTALVLAMAAVLFMLVLACASVANLLLARATSREREAAIRLALGGTRLVLVRQFMLESLMIGGAATVCGVVLGAGALTVARNTGASFMPWLVEARLDWRVVAFAVVLALVTTLLFGLVPALSVSRVSFVGTLREGSQTSTLGRARRFWRSLFTAFEVAMALVLVVGAGLLVRSFTLIMSEGPGFRTSDIFSVQVQLPPSRFPDTAAVRALYRNVTTSLTALPHVQGVSATHVLPLTRVNNDRGFLVEGRPIGPGQPPSDEQVRFVFPAFFATMAIPLREGRDIAETDNAGFERVIVVNEAFAAKIWPGESAMGKRIAFEGGLTNPQWSTVVGIVGDTRHSAPDAPAPPIFYVPATQIFNPPRELNLVVWTRRNATGIAQRIREQVLQVDAGQSNITVVSMSERLDFAAGPRRFVMRILLGFSAVALILASFGIYAVVAFTVRQRSSEIGIRLALGATPASAVMLIMRDGTTIITCGLVAGALTLWPLSGAMRSMLYGVGPWDPGTLVIVGAALTLCAFAACYIPARRAASVSPLNAIGQRD